MTIKVVIQPYKWSTSNRIETTYVYYIAASITTLSSVDLLKIIIIIIIHTLYMSMNTIRIL